MESVRVSEVTDTQNQSQHSQDHLPQRFKSPSETRNQNQTLREYNGNPQMASDGILEAKSEGAKTDSAEGTLLNIDQVNNSDTNILMRSAKKRQHKAQKSTFDERHPYKSKTAGEVGVLDEPSSDSNFSAEEKASSPEQLKNSEYRRGEDNIYESKFKIIIPPPENLIAKSVFSEEPIRTGAPIAFVKTDNLKGIERSKEYMTDLRVKASDLTDPSLTGQGATTRTQTKLLAEEIVKNHNEGKLVYCRFGKQYVTNLEKQLTSILSTGPNNVSTSLKSATYLINIKKLIKEHNIESENFSKLRTKSNVTKTEGPPQPYYNIESESDQTLVFESRFESGNLLAAIKISDTEYDLILQNDINTKGHTQWYFFRVANTRKNQKIKFNILNLAKTDSLYNQGMKVLAFSNNAKKDEGLGWHRVGTDIAYFQNGFKREGLRFTRYYYTFTFTHEFTSSNDMVYFSHCFPYTYSDLVDDLSRIERDSYTQNFFYRNMLCRTLAGNKCEYLTITSKDREPIKIENKIPSSTTNASQVIQKKQGIFLSARVHPGESNSSWMMKGLIDYLVSNAPAARALREKFIFKIVPMINPDGVINGNYRCSLCGFDLNRRWKAPSKVLQPVIFSIKRMVKQFSKEREIALYCDLHGHSRKKNIFMYGNSVPEKPDATRMFPFILGKICDFFSFESCRFSMHKSKETTARITMWRELKIPNIFTLEASFSGADQGELKDLHFTTESLMMMGRKILEALIVYHKIDVQATLNEIKLKGAFPPVQEDCADIGNTQLNFDSLQKELIDNKDLIKLTEGREDGESEDSGSDSDPSEDNLDEEEMAKIIPIKKQKKKVPDQKKRSLLDTRLPKKKIDEPPASSSPIKQNKQQPPQKAAIKSPVKRIFNYSNPLYDRLKLRQLKKVEMVDAWTQTSDREKGTNKDKDLLLKTSLTGAQSDNEEAVKNQQRKLLSSSSLNGGQNSKSKTQLLQHLNTSSSFSGAGGAIGISESTDFKTQKTALVHSLQNSNAKPRLDDDLAQRYLRGAADKPERQDSALSPQPQIRVRREPLKNMMHMVAPTSVAKFEEKLIKSHANQSPRTANPVTESREGTLHKKGTAHQRHYSIENSQQLAQISQQQQPNSLSSRANGQSELITGQMQQPVTTDITQTPKTSIKNNYPTVQHPISQPVSGLKPNHSQFTHPNSSNPAHHQGLRNQSQKVKNNNSILYVTNNNQQPATDNLRFKNIQPINRDYTQQDVLSSSTTKNHGHHRSHINSSLERQSQRLPDINENANQSFKQYKQYELAHQSSAIISSAQRHHMKQSFQQPSLNQSAQLLLKNPNVVQHQASGLIKNHHNSDLNAAAALAQNIGQNNAKSVERRPNMFLSSQNEYQQRMYQQQMQIMNMKGGKQQLFRSPDKHL